MNLDDELDRTLRSSRPHYASNRDELSLDEKARLRRIVGGNDDTAAVDAPSRSRRRGIWLTAAAAATVLVIATVAALVVSAPRPVYAATPPLPEFAHIDGAAGPLLDGLAVRALRQPSLVPGRVAFQSWSLKTEIGQDGIPTAQHVEPQETVVTHDGANAAVVVSAGNHYDAAGNPVSDPDVKPGSPIGEYTTPLPTATPPGTADEWGAYLQTSLGIEPGASSSETVLQLPSILNFWTLSPAQDAALLQYLAADDDLELAGSTIDRLGRPGIAFRGEPVDDGWQPTLVVDADTGRILAVETIYVGADRTDIPSPSVIDYTAWR